MLSAVPDVLGGSFKKPKPEQVKAYKDFLDEYAVKKGFQLNWKNTKNSNLEGASDDDDDTSTDVSGADDADLDLENEKPKTGKGKTTKPADDEDAAGSSDDEDDTNVEVDLEDETDLDDED